MPAFSNARAIHAAVHHDAGRVGLATMYRHSRVLAGQGVVDTVRGAGGEALYRLRRGSLTHHLTCRFCGRTVEVDGSEVWEWLARSPAWQGSPLPGTRSG